jgi:K+ transporter
LGHFGLKAVSLAWFGLVFPALLLTYTGQAAWLLSLGDLTDPANLSLCFALPSSDSSPAQYTTYLAYPAAVPSCTQPGFVGLQGGSAGPNGVVSNVFWWVAGKSFGSSQFKAILAVSTLASIVGSQALITGVFTILHQASNLGLFPFMRVVHTSQLYSHQIFAPGANLVLCVACLFVTGTFQHSANLTAVYGACVATAMLATTVLYAV